VAHCATLRSNFRHRSPLADDAAIGNSGGIRHAPLATRHDCGPGGFRLSADPCAGAARTGANQALGEANRGFIAAQKDMSAVVEKMQGIASSDKPSSRFEAELEAATKKHGFKNYAEYEAVAANISMVMAAIDPQTKAFTDPQAAIKKEMDDLTADKTIPENEKKQLIEELKEALKSAQPIAFPGNIELVKKYYDKIDAALG
jgi:hypothetical protein